MRQFNLIDALIELNLYLIVEDIFLQLDCQSLTNAERASPGKWRLFIQSSQKLYRKKVESITGWLCLSHNRQKRQKILGTTFWRSDAEDEE